ncbi:flagellar export chaperone FliS [Xylophilus sp. GW821-FHT01B05]
MFTPAHARAASTYRQASVEGASPHQLVSLLFEGLLQSLRMARTHLQRGDVAGKGEHITKAVRLIEEGLRMGLDDTDGGEIASNLRTLYDYSVRRLTIANLRNDDAPLAEVQSLIETVAEGWRGIAGSTGRAPQAALAAGRA